MRLCSYKRRRLCLKLVVIFSALHVIYAIILLTDDSPAIEDQEKQQDDREDYRKHNIPNPILGMLKEQGKPKCKGLKRPPEKLKETETFQEVVAGSSYVFSVFYDRRSAIGVVRAIVLAKLSDVWGRPHPNYCRLWVRGQEQPDIIPLTYATIKEHHEKT